MISTRGRWQCGNYVESAVPLHGMSSSSGPAQGLVMLTCFQMHRLNSSMMKQTIQILRVSRKVLDSENLAMAVYE